jgi:hypothetical protein
MVQVPHYHCDVVVADYERAMFTLPRETYDRNDRIGNRGFPSSK